MVTAHTLNSHAKVESEEQRSFYANLANSPIIVMPHYHRYGLRVGDGWG